MKKIRVFNLVLVLTFLAALLPVNVLAQGGGTGTCTRPERDENGNFDLTDLERAGDSYSECLQCVEILGGQVGIMTSFDQYVDSEGRYYLVPNFFTAMYMAFTGWAPDFSTGPVDAQLNGFEVLAALMGRYENVGGVFELFSDLNISPAQAAAITGKSIADDWGVPDVAQVFKSLAADAMFWVNLNVMLARNAWAAGDVISFRSMVLIYCDDPLTADPPTAATPFPTTNWTPPPTPGEGDPPPTEPVVTPVPTLETPPATPTPQPTYTPVPTATPVGGCAAATISRNGAGFAEAFKIDPPNPVVVGQDQSKRGVDVEANIVAPAVVYTYEKYEIVSSETKCVHENGTKKDADYDGCKYDWEGWSKKTTEKWGCVEYKEVYPDPVDLGTLQVKVELTAESQNYINEVLSIKYPGAKVRQPVWEVIPDGGWARYASMGGDKIFRLSATAEYIPLEDPGKYTVTVSGRTTGTPYTKPVQFSYTSDPFLVVFFEAALIQ